MKKLSLLNGVYIHILVIVEYENFGLRQSSGIEKSWELSRTEISMIQLEGVYTGATRK